MCLASVRLGSWNSKSKCKYWSRDSSAAEACSRWAVLPFCRWLDRVDFLQDGTTLASCPAMCHPILKCIVCVVGQPSGPGRKSCSPFPSRFSYAPRSTSTFDRISRGCDASSACVCGLRGSVEELHRFVLTTISTPCCFLLLVCPCLIRSGWRRPKLVELSDNWS